MTVREKPTVIALVGPTCSGKTALSLRLADSLGGEIVACDSRTVYRYFDIGTAKPSHSEMKQIPHHLIDVVDPDEPYTVAQYVESAGAAIKDIALRGRLPIVCGGTGFYARALLEGLNIPAVAPREDLRLAFNEIAEKEGNQALHDRLRLVDPATADRLHANDRFRIVRALEVYTVLGSPFSSAAGRSEPPFNCIWIALTARNRNQLYEAISKRFELQLAEGLESEVETLFQRYGPHQKLMHTVNYKELVQYHIGKLSRQEALTEAVRHNFHLARRQLIWFNANQQIKWFFVDEMTRSALEEAVKAFLKGML